MTGALARRPPPLTALSGEAAPGPELLRAPASGTPCVHWRLRIVEHVAPGMELVHELLSPEPVELSCRERPEDPARRVLLSAEHARLQAMPILFREGSAGALAVAEQFGLRGPLRVEEVVIRPGELVHAEGVLHDPSAALSRGPSRTIDAPLELLDPSLRLETSLSLRPVLLPVALGTAAALLGTVGVGAAVLHWWKATLAVGAAKSLPVPAEIGVRKVPRPDWP